jgi:hypothetical protein
VAHAFNSTKKLFVDDLNRQGRQERQERQVSNERPFRGIFFLGDLGALGGLIHFFRRQS